MSAFTIPLVLVRCRRNPVRPVRRHLSVAQGDELRLAVQVRERDGIGGPLDVTGARLRLSVLRDPGRHPGHEAGYGTGHAGADAGATCAPLWEGWGVAADPAAGCFDLVVPGAATAGWGGRYGYALQLDYDGSPATLASGVLHVLRGPVLTATSPPAPFVLDQMACDGPNPIG